MKKHIKMTVYSMVIGLVTVSSGLVLHHNSPKLEALEPFVTVQSEGEYAKEVIASGHVIGVRVESEGIYVLGTSEVETEQGNQKPCKDKLKKGDIIFKINDITLDSKEQLKEVVELNGEKMVTLEIERKGKKEGLEVKPVYSQNENTYKLGIWVKDGTQGIGTLTYVDPETGEFGALGHGITGGEIKKLMGLKEGEITKTTITTITKGAIGEPGQLGGTVEYTDSTIYGKINSNTHLGIYGVLNSLGKKQMEGERIPVGKREEVHEGYASILLDLESDDVVAYDIVIQKVSKYTSEPAKGMVIKIIDPELLEITNGIVQGMSGAPIVQDGKLIGAVTHVFVNEPTKGYGIFIENMLEISKK